MSNVPTITIEQFAEKCQQSPQEVIDVRMPVEYREAHIEVARNVPLDSLNPEAVMKERCHPDQPLYVICQGGVRSATACQKFIQAGLTDVVSVEGGTQAWIDAGHSVVRGKKAMSLERQVRIAAGSLVLLGAVLGYFWDINFVALSGFVGAGLIFAGITDTCGMGMLLAKMPWNQVGNQPSSCCTR